MCLAALVVALLGEVRLSADDLKAPLPADVVLHKVGHRDVQLTIVERGTLEAKDNHVVRCEVKTGNRDLPTIRWVVDDGSRVKQGDLLVEIDGASLQEQAANQKILADRADADRTAAEQLLALKKELHRAETARSASGIKSAEAELEEAKLDLKSFEEGELAARRKDVKGRMAQAEADVQLWRERLALAEKQLKEGTTTEGLVKAMRQKLEACAAVVEAVKAESENLEKFTIPRQRTLLKRRVELAQSKLEQERLDAPVRLKGAEANLESAEQDLKVKRGIQTRHAEQYRDLLDQIKKCKIYAPSSGVVVYHVPEQNRFARGQAAIIAQGEPVREGQKLLSIPDLSHMVINVHVAETLISHVKQGQTCQVRVDALPGKVLNGKVKSVAAVPALRDWASPDVKAYQTVVEITDSVERLNLKPGLSGVVTIATETKAEHVLAVPVESVVGLGDTRKKPSCFVVKGGDVEQREVVVGVSDGRWVEIKSGLKEGDEVVNDRRVLPDRVRVIPDPRSRFGPPSGPEK
jgi:multidrug efflux pump subunit AcrA (membrane-fusion protein)